VNRFCEIAGVGRAGYYRFRGRGETNPVSMDLRNEIQ